MKFMRYTDIEVGDIIKIHKPKRRKEGRMYVIEIIGVFYSTSFKAKYMFEDKEFDIYRNDVAGREFELLTKEEHPEYFL